MLIGSLKLYPYVHSRLVTLFRGGQAPRAINETDTWPDQHFRATSIPAAAPIMPTVIPVTPPVLSLTPTLKANSDAVSPTRIIIPSIGVNAHIAPVSRRLREMGGRRVLVWEVPERYVAGWHENSARPGEPGNTVINGHNTTHGEVFRELYTLRSGDTIILHAGDLAYTYSISETLILEETGQPIAVRAENARYVMPTRDERLTLVTCHPYGSLHNRLIVIARPVRTDEITAESFRNFRPLWKLWNVK